MTRSFTLWPGGPVFEQSSAAMPVTTDSVLLADFTRPGRSSRFLDMGSGSGILSVMLLWNNPALSADLVELMPGAAELSRRNLAANGLDGRAEVIAGDLRELRGRYDFIVTNPPYYPLTGGQSEDAARLNSRGEAACTLPEICSAAARLLGQGGKLFMVYPAARLGEVMRLMPENGLEPKRLRLVQATADSRASVFLMELMRSGRPGLVIEPALILKTPAGEDTGEVKRIYRLED